MRSTLSGKYLCEVIGRRICSDIGTGLPGLVPQPERDALWGSPDLWRGRWRSWKAQAWRPNGPRINAVTVGCGSRQTQNTNQIRYDSRNQSAAANLVENKRTQPQTIEAHGTFILSFMIALSTSRALNWLNLRYLTRIKDA